MLDQFQENLVFWVLWLATVLLCVQQTWAALSRRVTTLGLVPAVCMMYGYFYVLQSAIVAVTFGPRLSPYILALGQFVALLCLAGVLWGWHVGSRRASTGRAHDTVVRRPMTLWSCGVAVIVVGLVGLYTSVTAGASYKDSAYWYLLFHVAYPGIGICVNLISRRPEFRQSGPILLVIIASALLMYYPVVNVRRGPIFPFVVTVIYGYYLARPWAVRRDVVLGGLLAAGVTMLLFVTIRDYSSPEHSSWSGQRFERVKATDVLVGKAYEESDNEYLYHCCTVATCVELDRYQWATGYLTLASHWIPRSWWPDKPTLAQGWLNVISEADMLEVTGIKMSSGAATGGVAESFQQLSWFTPLFWFAIGWAMGRLYVYSLRHPDRVAPLVYTGVLAASHWLVSQGFGAAFVPGMIYVTTPLLIYSATGQRVARPAVRPAARVARVARQAVG